MNIPLDQWHSAIKALLVRSSHDAEFRAKCLANPTAAIQEISGLTVPTVVRFTETAEANSIMLPPFSHDPDEIFDEELLSNAAGGGAWGYSSIGDNTNFCEA